MRVQIEIADGPMQGVRHDLADGDSLSVGRTAKSKVVLAHDSYLSGLHFQIDIDGRGCVLRDAGSSNGTFVNEQRVTEEAVLRHGDRIVAGQTRFVVHMEEARNKATVLTRLDGTMITGREPAPLDGPLAALVQHLRSSSALPLYALAEVTSDAILSVVVARSTSQHELLASSAEVGGVSPSLVSLPADSPVVVELVRNCWGQGRIVFLRSNYPFESVRRHLRSFFLARAEDGRALRLRMQDPHLLQVYLSGCTTDEIAGVFGPIASFEVEDMRDASRCLEFTVSPSGLRRSAFPLATDARAAATA